MAKICLTGGFNVIPEGDHVFRIVDVTYKEEFGKLEIAMETAKGHKHTERFSLLNREGEPNQGALNAFSFFAKTAMNDFELEEIDHDDLVGRYIRCEVTHDQVESNRNPGKMVTFVRLGQKTPAEGFDEQPVAKKAFNLDSILG